MQPLHGAGLAPAVLAEFDFAPARVAVSRTGRIFVSFPRAGVPAAPATVVELVNGRGVPYPDASVNVLDVSEDEHRLVSVCGITTGPGNRLLVLDAGAPSLERGDPKAAKIYVVDLERNVILHGIGFRHDVCLTTSYLSDIVIDYARGKAGYAFVSDSGRAGPNALIVVDLDSGMSWRRLSGEGCMRVAVPAGFYVATESGPIEVPPVIKGIALSPDGQTLWWTPLGSYHLFSVDTDILCASHVSDEQILRHVTEHPRRDFASDGLDTDREGRVYFTDVTHGGIRRLIPSESRYEQLLNGARCCRWPDGVRIGPNHVMYITDSQFNRRPEFNAGEDLRELPYRLSYAATDGLPSHV
jgi:sugar lactone lactonase YvrE